MCSLGIGQFSYAQNNAEFADDFSLNSIPYRTGSFDESLGSGSATVVDNVIVLTAQQVEGTDFCNAFVETLEDTDSFNYSKPTIRSLLLILHIKIALAVHRHASVQ